MANLVSTLLLRMNNGFSGPARQVDRDAKKLDRTLAGISGRSSRVIAGAGKMMLGGAAAYLGAGAVKSAYTDAAAFDRHVSRILITADAAQSMADETKATIRSVAQETATPIASVADGLDSLVSAGRTLPDALAFLPAVTRTAAAAGADVSDIAKTADAIGTSMKISGGEMQSAFDILVAGGKAGKFELKDMAGELPSLAASAAAVGLKGKDGLRQLVAMLQMIRTQTGSSSEAATAMANVFQKMESEETANKFKKFGVDLRKEMAKARKEGKNLVDFFVELSAKTVKGDLSRLPQLFSDAQMQQGMRALLSTGDGAKRLAAALASVDGTTIADLKRVTSDAQSSVDRLANSWTNLSNAMAKVADKAGVPTALDATAKYMGAVADFIDLKTQGKSDKDLFVEIMKRAGKDPDQAAKYWEGTISGPIRSLQARAKMEQLSGLIDNANRAGEILNDHMAAQADLKSRYDSVRDNPNATPAQINAAKIMAGKYAELQRQTDLLVADLQHALDAANTAALETVSMFGHIRGGTPSGLPEDRGWTQSANVGGPKSGATQHPGRGTGPGSLGPLPRLGAKQEVMISPTPDEARALQAATEIRNKVQQYLSANPVTIPVRPGSVGDIGYEFGKQIQSEMNGSYSDNNGRR